VLYPENLLGPSLSYKELSALSVSFCFVSSVRWLATSKLREPLFAAAAAFRSCWSFLIVSKSASDILNY